MYLTLVLIGSKLFRMFGLFFQVGFGKGTASKQVWLDGIDPGVSESQLERQLSKYGKVCNVG